MEHSFLSRAESFISVCVLYVSMFPHPIALVCSESRRRKARRRNGVEFALEDEEVEEGEREGREEREEEGEVLFRVRAFRLSIRNEDDFFP